MKGCWVCLPWAKFQLSGILFAMSDHKGIITGVSSTQESLIFRPFQIFITWFPLTVKEQHPQERNVAVWEVAELHNKFQAKPLNLISVSDPLFPAISQLCALKFLAGNIHPMELELSLIPSKIECYTGDLFFSSHACRWETLCSTVLSNKCFIFSSSKAAHTFSSLLLWGSKEKTGKDKAFWGPLPGAEDKIQCPKWASYKKETRGRKNQE